MSIVNKRRLSKGNSSLNNLPTLNNIEYENEIDPMAVVNAVNLKSESNSRSSMLISRRRSIIGGSLSNISPTKMLAEQNRIAEMYKSVIKLSSENKLNEKNSWSFDLIDHMGAIIKEDSDEQKGVNFQKASCTLDASVKIYSNRVDDTYATSHRILESLSRNGTIDNEVDETNEDTDETKKPAKVGSKNTSNRLNISNTIEKNVDNINTKVENESIVDPIFHMMSKAFDEGGVKGMLLSNLRLKPNSASLIFADLPKYDLNTPLEQSPNMQSNESIEYLNYFDKCFYPLDELMSMTICPQLDEYRNKLNIQQSTVGFLDISSIIANKPVEVLKDDSTNKNEIINDFNDYDDNNELDFNHIVLNDDENQLNHQSLPRQSILNNITNNSSQQSNKFDWNAIFGNKVSSNSNVIQNRDIHSHEKCHENDNMSVSRDISVTPMLSDNNTYSFHQLDILKSTNTWAGLKHWKYANKAIKKVDKSNKSDSIDENSIHKKNEKKKNKKEKCIIDLTNKLDESLFIIPNQSLITLSTNQVDKMIESSNDLYLPIDNKITMKDFYRLFNISNIILPPNNNINLSNGLNEIISDSSTCLSHKGDSNIDIVWGKHSSNPLSTRLSTHLSNQFDDNVDSNIDQNIDNDYDDMIESSNEIILNEADGNIINDTTTTQLVQPKRIVQKIDIGYATVAKRVNVKKLKSDIWNQINNKLIDQPVNNLSFKKIVNDKTLHSNHEEASLSFYFICLLHLANENSLKIDNMIDGSMSDLMISKQ